MLTWSKTTLGHTYRRLRNYSGRLACAGLSEEAERAASVLDNAEDTTARFFADSSG
jgi:hypothetical protein